MAVTNCSCGVQSPRVARQAGNVWDDLVPDGTAETLLSLADVASWVGMALALLSLLLLVMSSWPRCATAWPRLLQFMDLFYEEAPVGPGVQEKMMECKAYELRGILQTTCCTLVPYCALAMEQRLPLGAVSLALMQLVLSLLCLFPMLVQPGSFDTVFCGVVLLLALQVTPFTCGEETLVLKVLLSNSFMYGLLAVRRKIRRRVPVHAAAVLAFALASAGTILVRGQGLLGERVKEGAAAQAVVVMLMVMAAPMQERRSLSRIENVLQLEEMKALLEASQCLLRSCFDVVVELDAAGCIVSNGPELGSLLLREGGRQCMRGLSFLELLEDGESFRERLAASAMQGLGLAESMHISVKDACGNSLRLEMMWFGYANVLRERRYVLGLREFAEQRPVQEAVLVTEPAYCGAESKAASEAASDSVCSGKSSGTGALVVIDSTDPQCPVQKVSRSFCARVGDMKRGRSLFSFLARPVEFYTWLSEGLQSEEPLQDYSVRLVMPRGDVKALCKVVREEEMRRDRVTLLFYSIQRAPDWGQATPMNNRGTSPRGYASSLVRHAARDNSPSRSLSKWQRGSHIVSL